MTTISSFRSEAIARGTRMLRTALGPLIATHLEDPGVVEIMLNPDGRLWIDRLSAASRIPATGSRRPMPSASFAWSPIMSVPRSMPACRACRPSCRKAASASRGWCRPSWQHRVSPSAGRRSRCSPSTTMSRPGSCRGQRPSCCAHAVQDRKNILVAGGTSTGKTTLVNALLAEVAKTGDRVVLIEDTRELQCAAPNLVALRTKDGAATLSDLVRSALAPAARSHPDRRGARRGGAGPPEGLGHRPSWRRRHLARRIRPRRAAPPRAAHPGSRRDCASRADCRDHRGHRGPRRSRRRAPA